MLYTGCSSAGMLLWYTLYDKTPESKLYSRIPLIPRQLGLVSPGAIPPRPHPLVTPLSKALVKLRLGFLAAAENCAAGLTFANEVFKGRAENTKKK